MKAQDAIRSTQVDGTNARRWADSVSLSLSHHIGLTIDTSISQDGVAGRFFQRAILHCLRDLHSAFCNATDVALSVTVREDHVRTELEALSEAIQEVESVCGIRIGKLHSGIGASETVLTTAAVGQYVLRDCATMSGAGSLYISGPLTDPSAKWDSLADVLAAFSEGERFATSPAFAGKDVSGDGLSGTVWQIAKDYSLDLSVDLASVPFISAVV